jgi:hypothetical protein
VARPGDGHRGASRAPLSAPVRRGAPLALNDRWGVHTGNAGALEFYRRLGAVGAEVRIMGVGGERLRALADAAPQG